MSVGASWRGSTAHGLNSDGDSTTLEDRGVNVFHYHLVTSELRDVEARYLGKLGFDLVARYGRSATSTSRSSPGVSWEKLDQDGFKLRLSELERGAVNVVVQPGHWRVPRVDHLGVVARRGRLPGRARARDRSGTCACRSTAAAGRSSSTNAGYRLEMHPPREWIEELLDGHATSSG